ncbi:MAG: hypothetical protein V7707_06980 [Motiliproteus sp.]
MNTAGLSFDNIPALKIPLGFFLTAPLFGILAGLLLLVYPEALMSRWHPAMLAIVHLLTLGFAGHVMLGALCQVLPVISAESSPLSIQQALTVRVGLGVGVLALSLFFITHTPLLAALAGVCLVLALVLFGYQLLKVLLRIRPAGNSITTIRFAALALLFTAVSGAMLLGLRAWPEHALLPWFTTDQHAIWGAMGWAVLLVIGVSFQVIPMFHVAPDFPAKIQKWLAPTLFISLLLSQTFLHGDTAVVATLILKITIVLYCVLALRTIGQRKRKLTDYTVRFWRLGLGCIAASLLLALSDPYLPRLLPQSAIQLPTSDIILAILFGFGGLISIIIGMLQKIVPFLIYLHLQRSCLSKPEKILTIPNMRQLLPTHRSRRQWQLHLTSLCGLLVVPWWPLAVYPAAILLLMNFGWLGYSILMANRCYLASR